MANEPELRMSGNLTADPDLRYTNSGTPALSFTIAQTPRVFDRAANDWKDGETIFMRCQAWGDLAEHITATATKGTRLIVEGRLQFRTYQGGSTLELVVEDAGPSLKFATATVHRQSRTQPTDADAAADGADSPR